MAKKYYWLKLKENFFTAKEIKKLRHIAGGDTYTVIYLKLMLLSLQDEGKLFFDGIEDTFSEELALELDEDPDNVKVTLMYLQKLGLLEETSGTEAFLTQVPEAIGKETDKAGIMRRIRAERAIGNNVTNALPDRYTEIDIEKEKDIDIEKKRRRFTPPSQAEVQEYITENGYQVDAGAFIDFYQMKDWMVGKNKMKDWKAAVRNWHRRDTEKKPAKVKTAPSDSMSHHYTEEQRAELRRRAKE